MAIENGKKAHSLDLHFLSLFPGRRHRLVLSQLALIRPTAPQRVYSANEEKEEKEEAGERRGGEEEKVGRGAL